MLCNKKGTRISRMKGVIINEDSLNFESDREKKNIPLIQLINLKKRGGDYLQYTELENIFDELKLEGNNNSDWVGMSFDCWRKRINSVRSDNITRKIIKKLHINGMPEEIVNFSLVNTVYGNAKQSSDVYELGTEAYLNAVGEYLNYRFHKEGIYGNEFGGKKVRNECKGAFKKKGPHLYAAILFALFAFACVGYLYYVIDSCFTDERVAGYGENDSSEDKEFRVSQRMQLTSIICCLIFSSMNAFLDWSCQIDPATSTVAFGMFLSGTIGFIADNAFGVDAGWEISQTVCPSKAMTHGFGSLVESRYARFLVTNFFDMFVSLIVFKPLYGIVKTLPFFRCGNEWAANFVVTMFIGVTTFKIYANQLRSQWAYPDTRNMSTDDWVNTNTVRICVIIGAIVYLSCNSQSSLGERGVNSPGTKVAVVVTLLFLMAVFDMKGWLSGKLENEYVLKHATARNIPLPKNNTKLIENTEYSWRRVLVDDNDYDKLKMFHYIHEEYACIKMTAKTELSYVAKNDEVTVKADDPTITTIKLNIDKKLKTLIGKVMETMADKTFSTNIEKIINFELFKLAHTQWNHGLLDYRSGSGFIVIGISGENKLYTIRTTALHHNVSNASSVTPEDRIQNGFQGICLFISMVIALLVFVWRTSKIKTEPKTITIFLICFVIILAVAVVGMVGISK